MKRYFHAIAAGALLLTQLAPLHAQAGDSHPINSAEDMALLAKLRAEAAAKARATPSPSPASSWYSSDNPWGPNYSGGISRDAAQHLLTGACQARGDC